jgi:hypothetical protein
MISARVKLSEKGVDDLTTRCTAAAKRIPFFNN